MSKLYMIITSTFLAILSLSCLHSMQDSDTFEFQKKQKTTISEFVNDLRNEKIPQLLKCPYCNFHSSQINEFGCHMRDNHDGIFCPICKKEYENLAFFFMHLESHYQNKETNKYDCDVPYCSCSYDEFKFLWKHIKETHPERVITVNENDLQDQIKYIVPPHDDLNDQINSILLICPYCDHSTGILQSYCDHMNDIHEQLLCPICQIRCHSMVELRMHLEFYFLNARTNKYHCNEENCKTYYGDFMHLWRHIRQNHLEYSLPFKADNFSCKSVSNNYKQYHKSLCSNSIPNSSNNQTKLLLQCPKCDFNSCYYSDYSFHTQEIHSAILCPICEVDCENLRVLYSHIEEHYYDKETQKYRCNALDCHHCYVDFKDLHVHLEKDHLGYMITFANALEQPQIINNKKRKSDYLEQSFVTSKNSKCAYLPEFNEESKLDAPLESMIHKATPIIVLEEDPKLENQDENTEQQNTGILGSSLSYVNNQNPEFAFDYECEEYAVFNFIGIWKCPKQGCFFSSDRIGAYCRHMKEHKLYLCPNCSISSKNVATLS